MLMPDSVVLFSACKIRELMHEEMHCRELNGSFNDFYLQAIWRKKTLGSPILHISTRPTKGIKPQGFIILVEMMTQV